jgi:hypothetical protein
MKHEKKVWPKYYQAIVDGKKNFELRLADWECHEGDTLILREWDPKNKEYTGREISKKITYVAKFRLDNLFWSEDDLKKWKTTSRNMVFR